MKSDIDLINKVTYEIKRNDDFIQFLNKKTEVTNEELMSAIATLSDNLQKYHHLNTLLFITKASDG
jgi:hypothetical protein